MGSDCKTFDFGFTRHDGPISAEVVPHQRATFSFCHPRLQSPLSEESLKLDMMGLGFSLFPNIPSYRSDLRIEKRWSAARGLVSAVVISPQPLAQLPCTNCLRHFAAQAALMWPRRQIKKACGAARRHPICSGCGKVV